MNDQEKFEMLKVHVREARRLAAALGATCAGFDMQFVAETMSPVIAAVERPNAYAVAQKWPDRTDHVTSGRIEDETISILVTERSEPIGEQSAA